MSGTQSESNPIAGRPGQTVESSTGLAVSESDPVDHRAPLILGAQTFHAITEAVARPMERRAPRGWWICFLISLAMLGLLGVSDRLAVLGGDRRLGPQQPRRLGLGHHQLRLLGRHRPRRHADLARSSSCSARSGAPSINRSAEAMTHLRGHLRAASSRASTSAASGWRTGCSRSRTRWAMWPNFRSPLLWDVFAVSTYFTVSLLFWYVGLIPDLATLRDRATTPVRQHRLRHASPSAGAARRATGSTTRRRT